METVKIGHLERMLLKAIQCVGKYYVSVAALSFISCVAAGGKQFQVSVNQKVYLQ